MKKGLGLGFLFICFSLLIHGQSDLSKNIKYIGNPYKTFFNNNPSWSSITDLVYFDKKIFIGAGSSFSRKPLKIAFYDINRKKLITDSSLLMISGVERFFNSGGELFLNKMLTSEKYGIPLNKLFYRYSPESNGWELLPSDTTKLKNHTRFLYKFGNLYFVGNQVSDSCNVLLSKDNGNYFRPASFGNIESDLLFYPLSIFELNNELFVSILSKQSRVNIFKYSPDNGRDFVLVHREMRRDSLPQFTSRKEVLFKNSLYTLYRESVIRITEIEPSIRFSIVNSFSNKDSIPGIYTGDFIVRKRFIFFMVSFPIDISKTNSPCKVVIFRSSDGINWSELFEFTTAESENISCFEEVKGTFYFGTSAGFSQNFASVTENCGNIYMIRKAYTKRKVNIN